VYTTTYSFNLRKIYILQKESSIVRKKGKKVKIFFSWKVQKLETKTKVVQLGNTKKKESNTNPSGRITIATPEKDFRTKVAWELFKGKVGIGKETQAFYKLWELAASSNLELFPTEEEIEKVLEE